MTSPRADEPTDPGPAGVCVLGSFMMDLTLRAPRRPAAGETIIGTGFDMYLGGKGFNQAVAAARSGAPTSMIGRLGDDDFGVKFRDGLRHDGIDARHVLVDPTEGTGIGGPLVEESGENSIVVVPRANWQVSIDDVRAARDLIASAAVLLLQMEVPTAALLAAARVAKQSGVVVVLNPAPAADTIEPFAGLVDLVVPNIGEALHLTGGDEPPDDARLAAAALRDLVRANVIVTMGDQGALVLDREGYESFPAHVVDVVDTVAAGDVFCGALAAGLALGEQLRPAIEYANAAAAVAVTRRGSEPSIPTRAMVDEQIGDFASAISLAGPGSNGQG